MGIHSGYSMLLWLLKTLLNAVLRLKMVGSKLCLLTAHLLLLSAQ